ncbi:hypothetical protein PIB30_056093 [Stylosanthes scabra]|uniref:Uncharacterized protein n=1 Tax=Stylosanthes scabra TaxID=79078 RepID=A0ABU6VLP5_9FABA|nr:hypothetical protein [Stylosanthes scabra]
MEDVIYEAPPQDHSLEKYFKTYDDLNGYILTFADRKEIPPRFTKGLSTSGFGYVCLWTRLFRHIKIDVLGEAWRSMVPTSVINTRTIYHMGRELGAQEEEEQEQAPLEPQVEAQAGPSKQPSMRDLMQMLQSMEQNMGNRFQRIEDNQARMDRRLQRMERHMKIQEDEDQE